MRERRWRGGSDKDEKTEEKRRLVEMEERKVEQGGREMRKDSGRGGKI